MRRGGLLLVAAVTIVGGVAACGAPGSGSVKGAPSSDGLSERVLRLSDGRTVTCVVFSGVEKGGLSCDWLGAR